MNSTNFKTLTMQWGSSLYNPKNYTRARLGFVYKIPYRRARALPSASREQRYLAYKARLSRKKQGRKFLRSYRFLYVLIYDLYLFVFC